VSNVDVIEQDVFGHGPKLNTDTANLVEAGNWGEILEEVGIGDLARSPDSLVGRVVDEGGAPLALIIGVTLHGPLPFATTDFITLGVADDGCQPFTILFVVPFLGLLSFGVGNGVRFIIEPTFRFDGIFIEDLVRSVLIPILGLLGIGISDTALINPVIGLGVLGVIDFLLWVDRRAEVFEEAALSRRVAVDKNLIGVVGAE